MKDTSKGLAVDSGYLASGMGFDKDAAKKTAGLSEFIRLLRDVWPVRQHQSVALKCDTWREMQCWDALRWDQRCWALSLYASEGFNIFNSWDFLDDMLLPLKLSMERSKNVSIILMFAVKMLNPAEILAEMPSSRRPPSLLAKCTLRLARPGNRILADGLLSKLHFAHYYIF